MIDRTGCQPGTRHRRGERHDLVRALGDSDPLRVLAYPSLRLFVLAAWLASAHAARADDKRPTPSRPPSSRSPASTRSSRQAIKAWEVPGPGDRGRQEWRGHPGARGSACATSRSKLPVTPKTLFAIGSCTKAFTTFVMGTLVDEGKLDWDKPVRTYIPELRFYDRAASELITPRDLVTHRSGLPRHDLVWYNATLSRKEIVDRLPYLEPSETFRSKFQYNNIMFMTAGYLVDRLTGQHLGRCRADRASSRRWR